MIITFFGAAGHIGVPSLEEILKIPEIDKVKVLLERNYKRNKLVKNLAKKNPGKIEIFYGTVASKEDVEKAKTKYWIIFI